MSAVMTLFIPGCYKVCHSSLVPSMASTWLCPTPTQSTRLHWVWTIRTPGKEWEQVLPSWTKAFCSEWKGWNGQTVSEWLDWPVLDNTLPMLTKTFSLLLLWGGLELAIHSLRNHSESMRKPEQFERCTTLTDLLWFTKHISFRQRM